MKITYGGDYYRLANLALGILVGVLIGVVPTALFYHKGFSRKPRITGVRKRQKMKLPISSVKPSNRERTKREILLSTKEEVHSQTGT